jgi:exopolysaccharide biosynthesis polyprenyl glycosylphosphotransferase
MHSREKQIITKGINLFFDTAIIFISFCAAYWIKVSYLPPNIAALYPLSDYAGIFLIIVPLWLLIFKVRGLYEGIHAFGRNSREIALSIIIGIVLLIVALFVGKVQYVSRILLVLFGALNIVCMIAGRGLVELIAHMFHPKEYWSRRVIVAGDDKGIEKAARLLAGHVPKGTHIIGYLEVGPFAGSGAIEGLRYLGQIKDVEDVIHVENPDEVIFVVGNEHLSSLKDAVYCCELRGIRIRLLADFFDMRIARIAADEFCGVPAISISTVPQKMWQLFFKQVLDFFIALVLFAVTLPLFVVLAVLVKLDSPGSAVFTQLRVGLRARKFRILKLRTMVDKAEEYKFGIADLNEVQGPVFKMEQDPRVTKAGKFIRKYYLDEIPQFLNVLLGEMSLVGPRPATPEEVELYHPWQRRRLSMKPGITGSWQLPGIGVKDFDERVKLDLEYIDNWSLWLDCKFAMRALMLILGGKGV